MCGLSGILDTSGRCSPAELAATADRMAETLTHRGPDDRGVWASPSGYVALGHQRLSIVDLSAAGRQPMMSADGRWVIVYNGELYNTRELRARLELRTDAYRGHSDTEVLVEAIARWGVVPTLRQAVGMLAFAAWDNQKRELWLARDRFGEKPLYYGRHGQSLLFASELKALRAVQGFSPPIDRNALTQLLRYSYIPAPRTIYEGVKKLLPGHVLCVPATGPLPEPEPYWSPVAEAESTPVRPPRGEAAVDELEELLAGVVADRMVADVPLGAFLSGGIDSSVIVAMMQRCAGRQVRTFTIGFAERAFDESSEAAAVARHLGTDHTELIVSPGEARATIPLLSRMYDEPFADSSQIPTHLVSRLARRHVTVALSGDAGDELFGGYDRYRYFDRLERIRERVPRILRQGGARAIGSVSVENWNRIGAGPIGRLGPSLLRSRTGERAHKFALILAANGADGVYRSLMSVDDDPSSLVIGGSEPPGVLNGLQPTGTRRSPIEQAMLLDTLTYLPDDILTKVDRASMAESLEVRVPLLDPEVFRFAWGLHSTDRVRGGQGKWVLRRLLHRHVPEHLVERPKMGFGVPIGSWLRGPLRSWADELLDPSLLVEQGYLDANQITRRWSDHRDGRADLQYQLWPILMFQAWLTESAS